MPNKILKLIVVATVVFLAVPLIAQVLKPAAAPAIDGADVAEPDPAPAAPPQPARQAPSIMTETQFSQMVTGMTYAQCVEFVGSEGQPTGRDPGGGQEYSWQLVSDGSGAAIVGVASLKFHNGILYGKGFNRTQGGMPSRPMNVSVAMPAQRPAAPPYICRPVNSQIKDGCDYATCARLLGMDGTYLGQQPASFGTRAADGTMTPAMLDVYVWHNAAARATLTLSFRDGKLSARQVSVGAGAGGR